MLARQGPLCTATMLWDRVVASPSGYMLLLTLSPPFPIVLQPVLTHSNRQLQYIRWTYVTFTLPDHRHWSMQSPHLSVRASLKLYDGKSGPGIRNPDFKVDTFWLATLLLK